MHINSCKVCHQKLVIKKDPLDISHSQLIKEKKWSSCLGCHDFHGNHKTKSSESIKKIFTQDQINKYFDGSISPYGKEKFYKAIKGKRYDDI